MTQSDVQRPPGRLAHLLVLESVLRNTITGLSYGAGREMLCYWLGAELKSDRTAAVVLTAAFPHIESSYAQFRLREGQMGLITTWCAERDLWLLAQVHTHPTDEPHSEADECWPASHRDGFLSIVFPFFASMSNIRTPGWSVYESQGRGKWLQVDSEKKLRIIPEIWLPETSRAK